MAALRKAARDLVIDAWSSLSHKAPLRDEHQARISGWTPKSWVGEEHRRRLAGYMILAAYDANVSREFLDGDDADRDERREYGDAGLIIDTVLAAVLGETQEITVPGAEAYDQVLDQDQAEPAEGEEPAEDAPDEATLAANAAARALSERQEFLRGWANDVHLTLRLTDVERNAVRYGDGVLLLGWNADAQRPVPAIMDPGFYFPVLPDTIDGYEYPTRVHFAWEIPPEDSEDKKLRVRRITYDLRDLEPSWDPEAADGDGDWVDPPDTRRLTETDEESGLAYSVWVRDYPWGESRTTCYRTDATWIVDDIDEGAVDAFTLATAETIEARDVDLGIDFLPVVHLPNTPPGGDHFGQSSLARVLQLIDDLQSADTDAQAASATTGSPILAMSGSATNGASPLTGRRGGTREIAPGAVFELGEGGSLDAVDTSSNLAATRDYVTSLRDRLLVNARLPGALVGTVEPNEVPSGFAMLLSFGPLTAMIRQMRLVRSVKYPLLLKMVQRLYLANGVDLPGGDGDQDPTVRAELALGSFLPSDQAGTLEVVKSAYVAKLISLETAVQMLLEAGFPVDDVAEEIARIQSRDFAAANELADATGDQGEVRSYLGLSPVTEATGTPTININLPGSAQPATGEPVAGGTGVGVPNPTDSGSGTG